MKRDINLWQFVGFAITSLAGSLLHFLYYWTDSIIVAPFSAVNESTWEHMKLIYFPMLVFSLIQSRFFREYKSFWCVKLVGITTALTLIPVLFYTANGAFGKTPDIFNIAIFFISAAVAFLLEAYLLKKNSLNCPSPLVAVLLICLIGLSFIIFTFIPPQFPLFQDPISGTYGLNT